MSCPDHPQWYHDRDDCPFCVAIEIRAEQQRRAITAAEKDQPCRDYRPDHNGECLNCDEPYEMHQPNAFWHAIERELGLLEKEYPHLASELRTSIATARAAEFADLTQQIAQLQLQINLLQNEIQESDE